MIGNALEWYDYALYAQFLYIISEKFFPQTEYSYIFGYAVFAVGCFGRPFGGVLLGHIGDKIGRRLALVIGIMMMAIPTAMIGLLPSYETMGIASPILLVLIRLIQGFALGGEFSGCIAYIVEHSPMEKRGIVGSSAFVSMCFGMLMGVFVAQLFAYVLPKEQLYNWGWRVPFILGLFIGLIGLYIRSHLSESPVYKEAKAKGYLSRTPVLDTFTKYWRETLLAILIYINVTAPFYTVTVFMKTYVVDLGYSHDQSSVISSIILITLMICFPISAYISDKIGRKPIIVWSSVVMIIALYPIFYGLHTMNYLTAILSQIIFSAILGFYMGPVPTILVELFPTRVRFSGVAISYNLSVAIFGGTAPIVGAALYESAKGQILFPYYLIALAFICLASIYFYKETYRYNLLEEVNHG